MRQRHGTRKDYGQPPLLFTLTARGYWLRSLREDIQTKAAFKPFSINWDTQSDLSYCYHLRLR